MPAITSSRKASAPDHLCERAKAHPSCFATCAGRDPPALVRQVSSIQQSLSETGKPSALQMRTFVETRSPSFPLSLRGSENFRGNQENLQSVDRVPAVLRYTHNGPRQPGPPE